MRRVVSALSPVVALLMVGLGVPAFAGAPLAHDSYSGSNEPFTECGGAYDGLHSWTSTQTILDSNPSLEGQFFRFSDSYTFRDVLTNPVNDEQLVISGRGVFKELQPRSQGDGIFAYSTHDVGMATISDASGRVLLREAGVIRFSYVFDTLGDGTPGGRVLEETPGEISGPHPTWNPDFDFCGFVASVIG